MRTEKGKTVALRKINYKEERKERKLYLEEMKMTEEEKWKVAFGKNEGWKRKFVFGRNENKEWKRKEKCCIWKKRVKNKKLKKKFNLEELKIEEWEKKESKLHLGEMKTKTEKAKKERLKLKRGRM